MIHQRATFAGFVEFRLYLSRTPHPYEKLRERLFFTLYLVMLTLELRSIKAQCAQMQINYIEETFFSKINLITCKPKNINTKNMYATYEYPQVLGY